jgi:hypothetical protein
MQTEFSKLRQVCDVKFERIRLAKCSDDEANQKTIETSPCQGDAERFFILVGLDIFGGMGYNIRKIEECDNMSIREMFKHDVDIMPDDVFGIMQAIWTIARERNDYYFNEIPNAETLAAMEETDYNTYNSVEDMFSALSRFDNEEH